MKLEWKSFVAGVFAAITLLFVINQAPSAGVSAYQIVSTPDPNKLAELVQAQVDAGWAPTGGISVVVAGNGASMAFQPMVK